MQIGFSINEQTKFGGFRIPKLVSSLIIDPSSRFEIIYLLIPYLPWIRKDACPYPCRWYETYLHENEELKLPSFFTNSVDTIFCLWIIEARGSSVRSNYRVFDEDVEIYILPTIWKLTNK